MWAAANNVPERVPHEWSAQQERRCGCSSHPPKPDPATVDPSNQIIEIAQVRRRFGYRRIHDLLDPRFPGVNHKRVYRLYTQVNLTVRKRKKAKRPLSERVPLQLAQSINEVWSMDFVSDSPSNGRRIKCLTMADDFSHESVGIAVDYGIPGVLCMPGS